MINVNLTMKEILNLPVAITDEQYVEAVVNALGFANIKELFPCDIRNLIDAYQDDPECRFIRNWPCSVIALKAMCAEKGAYKGVGGGLEIDVLKACVVRAVQDASKAKLDKDHVLHALKDVYFANAGDDDTEHVIEALTADIFGINQTSAKAMLIGG